MDNTEWDNFSLDSAEWGDGSRKNENKDAPKDEGVRMPRRKTELLEIPDNILYRRAYGEMKLLELTDMLPLKENHSYHFITGGNVDSLSFLKFVLLHCKKLDYLLCSTWCMAASDVLQFREWVENGVIKNLDFYVGEIFPRSYTVEWIMLNKLLNDTNCGRIVSFNNHSKIYAGESGEFHFVIESSANINTNPRTEQGVITVNEELYYFYKHYFDKIK